MHRILERQLKRYLNGATLSPEFAAFLKIVSRSYDDFDADRTLIERSLELSSKEQHEKNRALEEEVRVAKQRTEDLELLNKAMVGRELRMVELKREIDGLRGRPAVPEERTRKKRQDVGAAAETA